MTSQHHSACLLDVHQVVTHVAFSSGERSPPTSALEHGAFAHSEGHFLLHPCCRSGAWRCCKQRGASSLHPFAVTRHTRGALLSSAPTGVLSAPGLHKSAQFGQLVGVWGAIHISPCSFAAQHRSVASSMCCVRVGSVSMRSSSCKGIRRPWVPNTVPQAAETR